ncbi:MAG TPA: 4Fe-4S binding protein [Acidimicrobiales bacterium]|nr:4Fe-4S binding protein [Acidimicrobiales bacterium]
MSRVLTLTGAPAGPTTVLISDACTACGACLVTCPTHALRPAPRRPAVVDDRCTGCLACVEVCPRAAVTEVRR